MDGTAAEHIREAIDLAAEDARRQLRSRIKTAYAEVVYRHRVVELLENQFRIGLVRMERAPQAVPRFSSRYLNFSSKRSVSWYAYTHKISASGVMGDPTKATAEKGAKMWSMMIGHLVNFVNQLKNMTLKEIYQKKY